MAEVSDLAKAMDLKLPEKYVPWKPSPHQAAFLLVPHKEAFYGGAAGGGKSIALLMGALQYVEDGRYKALILRRTFADLAQPGALIDIAHEWLGPTDAQWNESKHTWTFPSGAILKFGHMANEADKTQYQGGAYQYVGFDELTHFSESMYTYLFSRMRKREGIDIPIRMRAAGNPGGTGHQWVKERFIDPPDPDEMTTAQIRALKAKRIYIPSTLEDNPHLDRDDYVDSLMELDIVTRNQLMNGDWDIEADGNMFKREWFDNRILSEVPKTVTLRRKVRYWDLASTDEAKAIKDKGDPDYTASVLQALGDDGNIYILEITRDRLTPAKVEELVRSIAERDGISVAIHMEQEPGSSGANTISTYQRLLMGFNFRGDRPTGNKIERARTASAACEHGFVHIIKGWKTKEFLIEAQAFPMGTHDDMVDAFAAGLLKIAQTAIIGREYKKKPKGLRRRSVWG